jgi:hypothetical protein
MNQNGALLLSRRGFKRFHEPFRSFQGISHYSLNRTVSHIQIQPILRPTRYGFIALGNRLTTHPVLKHIRILPLRKVELIIQGK